jgi:ceramide glucosyltransferase
MVTALYRGRAASWTLGAIGLGALGISTDFQAGVLTARLVESGIHFGLGSTLACAAKRWRPRRSGSAGGSAGRRLRDGRADFACGLLDSPGSRGRRDQRSGVFSGRIFEPSAALGRTVRDSRRWGYVGLIFTHLLPLALANVAASGASFGVSGCWAWLSFCGWE